MKNKLALIGVLTGLTALAAPAMAHDNDGDRWGYRGGYEQDRDWRGRGHAYGRHGHRDHCDRKPHYYERERVVVRERPVVYEPVYYTRRPAVVVGVSVPPIIIPF